MGLNLMIFSFLFSLSLSFNCDSIGFKDIECNTPKAEFNKKVIELGIVTPNVSVSDTIKLINVGCSPLIIHDIKTSCGCTIAEFTRTPISPNKSGFVVITFKSSTPGKFMKSIIIVNNTEEKSHLIRIKGIIITPE